MRKSGPTATVSPLFFLPLHQVILLEISTGDSEIFKVKIKLFFQKLNIYIYKMLFPSMRSNASCIKGLNGVEYRKCGI